MRILFALTTVLVVSSPTLTSTTANSVGYPVKAPVLDLHGPLPQPKPAPQPQSALVLSLPEIEGFVGKLNEPITIAAKKDEAQLARLEESAVEPQDDDNDGDGDEDDVAVTIPVERVCEALVDAASEHGLPIGFFARLLWQESKFDQWARSPVGAMGVAQFMPLTAIEFGLRNPFDPIASVEASARFLRQLRDQFGNLGLAAAAYNAGGGKIRKWLNGQTSLPEETQNYVQTITGHSAKRWTVTKPLQISFALPGKAPCDGVEGLSRTVNAALHEVKLTGLASDLLEQAAAAQRAKIAAARAARNKRHGVARAKGGRKVQVVKTAGKRNAAVRYASASAR